MSAADSVDERVQIVEDIIGNRFSCRAYLDKQVPHETITRIVETAQKSASWCNSQAWQLHLTQGAGTERFRTALSTHAAEMMGDRALPLVSPDIPMPAEYVGVYSERRRACGLQLYETIGVIRGDRVASAQAMLKNFSFFGAPHVAVITTPVSLGTYGVLDCGLFVSTFLTVAQSHGLGTIAQGAIAVYSAFVREYFEVPEDRNILCGISFGYPDMSAPINNFRTQRAPVEDVVQWIDA